MNTNILSKVVFGSFLALALAACTEEFVYTPAPQEAATKTYVKLDETAQRSYDVDGSDILVRFVRTSGDGAHEITVALADTSGLFSLKSTTVSFAAGETTAHAAVTYSYDAMDPNATYGFTVSIASGETSQYTPIALPLTCKKVWKKLGKGQFADTFFIGIISEKEFIQSPDGTPKYRMLNPFTKDEIESAGCVFESEIPYIEFTIGEDGSVYWGDYFSTGFVDGSYSIFYGNPNWYNGNAEAAAQNAVVGENLIQICYVATAVSGGKIAGSYGMGYSYMSLPGGPDLNELL